MDTNNEVVNSDEIAEISMESDESMEVLDDTEELKEVPVGEEDLYEEPLEVVGAEDAGTSINVTELHQESVQAEKASEAVGVNEILENVTETVQNAQQQDPYRNEKVEQAFQRMKQANRLRENEEFLAGWKALEAARNSEEFVRGIVTSWGEQSLDKENPNAEKILCLRVKTEARLSVLIPFDEIFRVNPILTSRRPPNLKTRAGRDEYVRRQQAMAAKLYGQGMEFVVTDLICAEPERLNMDSEYYILGSRRKANMAREAFYFDRQSNGKRRLEEGDPTEGTVISVGNHSLRMLVGGVDVQVSIQDLTYEYIGSAEELNRKYKVNDRLPVVIDRIVDHADGSHSVYVTCKPFERLQAGERREKVVKVGDVCCGTITRITKPYGSQNVCAYIYLDGLELPAKSMQFPQARYGRLPVRGDIVRVRITGFLKSGLTRVNVLGFHGPGLVQQ